ncbi:unnamed protein product [Mucor hiemalis]
MLKEDYDHFLRDRLKIAKNLKYALLSIMETDTKCVTLCQEIETEENGTGDPRLAHTVLVPQGITDETIGQTRNIQTQEDELNRMAIIRKERRIQGLTVEESVYLEDCIRECVFKSILW